MNTMNLTDISVFVVIAMMLVALISLVVSLIALYGKKEALHHGALKVFFASIVIGMIGFGTCMATFSLGGTL